MGVEPAVRFTFSFRFRLKSRAANPALASANAARQSAQSYSPHPIALSLYHPEPTTHLARTTDAHACDSQRGVRSVSCVTTGGVKKNPRACGRRQDSRFPAVLAWTLSVPCMRCLHALIPAWGDWEGALWSGCCTVRCMSGGWVK